MTEVPASQPDGGTQSCLDEIMALIETRSADPRLLWSPDRMTVRIVLSKLVLGGVPRQAAGGRRVRLDDEWRATMAEHGWFPAAQPGVFTRLPDNERRPAPATDGSPTGM